MPDSLQYLTSIKVELTASIMVGGGTGGRAGTRMGPAGGGTRCALDPGGLKYTRDVFM